MKNFKNLFMLIFVLISSISYIHAQNNDKQVIEMLKEFYSAYNKAWIKGNNPNIILKKIDSLEQKYCTIKLRKELKKLHQTEGLDHDIFTNDFGTNNESLKTMSIINDPKKKNEYLVSYLMDTEDPNNKKIKVTVIIHIIVENEKGSYKINDVK